MVWLSAQWPAPGPAQIKLEPGDDPDWGLRLWAPHLINMMFDGPMQQVGVSLAFPRERVRVCDGHGVCVCDSVCACDARGVEGETW